MEKQSRVPANIPGTINGQNAQLLVSSGIHALDNILGGGLPVGTVAIIEEDMHGTHAKITLDYFLAEGVASHHSTLVASLDTNPHHIIKTLPAAIHDNSEENAANLHCEKLKIAFRYQNLRNADCEPEVPAFGHSFDLSKTMSLSDIENSDISYWNGNIIENVPSMFANPAYNELLKSIKDKIKDGKFFLKDNNSKRTVLRIGIHSLGSPMWLPQRDAFYLMNESRDLEMFIFCLRALVRSAFAVAVITIPTYLYHENSLDRCIHSSDIAMRLQAFSGTELESNLSLADYHGFFHLTKLAAINSLTSKHPGAVEYVFKLRRKKFVIEKLHLPPDIQGASDNKPSVGCGGGGGGDNHLLDF